ncbi:MAG: hypothetical protein E7035_00290 [Verrucomicrobiaceae bacterium]|nr:hypothetical protein [Verrucomicrobiaceae bacterium]
MKSKKILFVLAVFFCIQTLLFGVASDKHSLRKNKSDKKFTEKLEQEQQLQDQQQRTPIKTKREIIYAETDMRFGKVVRVQDNIATVQIISKIPASEIPPKFLACNYKLEPVAELESLNTGYKDCFIFKIINGKAIVGDNVIVRYYKKKIEQ